MYCNITYILRTNIDVSLYYLHNCIVSVQVSEHFPNSSILIRMVSIGGDNFPRFTMLPGELRGHLSGQVYFSVQTPNGNHVRLCKTRVVSSFAILNVYKLLIWKYWLRVLLQHVLNSIVHAMLLTGWNEIWNNI